MASHNIFTIVTDIIGESEETLHLLLTSGPVSRLQEAARCSTSPASSSSTKTSSPTKRSNFIVTHSKLVFECNIDGPVDRYLDQLIADPAIDLIYQHCDDYPLGDGRTRSSAI